MHLCISLCNIMKVELFMHFLYVFIAKVDINDIFYMMIIHLSFCKFVVFRISKRIVYDIKKS